MTQPTSEMPKGQSSEKTDVIELLVADHQTVKELFKEFEALKDKNDNPKKSEIVKRICLELTVHIRAEEKILYPAARKVIYNEDLMDEADVEHAAAKELIAQLEVMSPDESHYDAKVIVLNESITHHVKEEEGEMFPLIKNSKLDRETLGKELGLFKDELNKEMMVAANN